MTSRVLPRILKIITTVLIIFILAAFVIMIFGILLAGVKGATVTEGQKAFETLTMTVPIQFVPAPDTYSLASDSWGTGEIVAATGEVAFESTNVGSLRTGVELIVLLLVLGVPALILLIILRRIFSSMIEDTPFIHANIGRIRWIAALLILISLLAQLVQARLGQMMLATVQSSGLELTLRFNFDLGMIVVGLIIFSLAEVFRYGLELQTETNLTV